MKFSLRSIKEPNGHQQYFTVSDVPDGNVKVISELQNSQGVPIRSGSVEFSARGAYDFASALQKVAAFSEDMSAPVDPKDAQISELKAEVERLKKSAILAAFFGPVTASNKIGPEPVRHDEWTNMFRNVGYHLKGGF